MPEHIGNAGIKAMAWAERGMVTLSPQTRQGKSPGEMAQGHHRLSVSGFTRPHAQAATVRSAPAENETLARNQGGKEERARASETLAAKTSALQIDTREIADRVYRLMQHDLILERERATKLGG